MENRRTILFLGSLFLVILIVGMLYLSNFKTMLEGLTATSTSPDMSGNTHDMSGNTHSMTGNTPYMMTLPDDAASNSMSNQY
jgi:hypothetical protein